MNSWLEASGQRWKMRLAEAGTIVMIACFALAFYLPRVGAVLIVLGLLAGMINLVLPHLVRCEVCGLRLNESTEVIELSRGERLLWLDRLEACPLCGDTGKADGEWRERWKIGHPVPPPSYWSKQRVLIAAGACLLVWLGLNLLARLDRVGP